MNDRANKIIKVSVIGIIMNIFLTIIKIIVGIFVGAVSIILDAINNLSDAVSQIITILGTALSTKAPNKKHPFGYGRIEYVTSQIMAVIIISIGAISLKEAIEKIISPNDINYTYYSLIIIFIAVILKIAYSIFTKIEGKKLNSQNLLATSTDSLMDAFLTLGTLIAGLVVMLGGFNFEGYIGCIISILIFKAGVEIMVDAIKDIIGNRVDANVSKKIKDIINSYDEVIGTYDLMLHEYGPTKTIGSAHIEVDDKMTAAEIHSLTRKITEDIFLKTGIILTIGIYATNDISLETIKIKNYIQTIITQYEDILEIHGFYINDNRISFDLVFDFKCKDRIKIIDELKKELKNMYSNYEFDIVIDNDVTD